MCFLVSSGGVPGSPTARRQRTIRQDWRIELIRLVPYPSWLSSLEVARSPTDSAQTRCRAVIVLDSSEIWDNLRWSVLMPRERLKE